MLSAQRYNMAQMFKRWKAGGRGQSRAVRCAARPSVGVPARRTVLVNMLGKMALLSAAFQASPVSAAEFASTGALAIMSRKGEYALSDEVRLNSGLVCGQWVTCGCGALK